MGCLMLAALAIDCSQVDQQGTQQQSASTTSAASAGTASVEPAPPVAFTKWSDHRNQGKTALTIQAAGPQVVVQYDRAIDGTIVSTSEPAFHDSATSYVRYGSYSKSSDYVWIFRSSRAELNSWYAFADQPAIEILKMSGDSAKSAFAEETRTPFGTQVQQPMRTQRVGVVANPYSIGWDFQSFGAWESAGDGMPTTMGASSYGAATSPLALPGSGSATFVGKLGGLYVSPAGQGSIAAADITVDVNFGTRALRLASSDSIAVRPTSNSYAAPNLNISGSLTYTPGSSAFTGTLVNAGGTMSGVSNGQFYGPAAQELGGVFALKSTTTAETFVGAYGAKR
jgi:hypothetical protein